MIRVLPILLLFLSALGCNSVPGSVIEADPWGRVPNSDGSTNLEVAPEYADIGDDAMHEYLLGRARESGQPRYLGDILRYPESAFIAEVPVPKENEIYGPARGQTLPIATFLTFPSNPRRRKNIYAFPYHDAEYGLFEDMLGEGEAPRFAEPDGRYPLIILAHGAVVHGIYDVRRAHDLASHGYIVAVINF